MLQIDSIEADIVIMLVVPFSSSKCLFTPIIIIIQ